MQEIVDRTGWVSGNSLALYVSGTGTKEAGAFEGNPAWAALLVIDYVGAVTITPNPPTNYPIAKGNKWSFNDKGTDLGTVWKNLTNNSDSSWSSGNAVLGYADADIQTTVSYGNDANNKHITTYFAKRFNVPNMASVSDSVNINVDADDGAIIYLNGNEVGRINMPTGPISYTTLASSNIPEPTSYKTIRIHKNLLLANNKIAVEIHQVVGTSSDIRFDLEMLNYDKVVSNPPALGCLDGSDHIACFTSMMPTAQGPLMKIPSSHSFQYIFSEGNVYNKGTITNALGAFDFTGYIPENMTNSSKGHLSINHETNPGGLSMLDIRYNPSTEKWLVDSSRAIDFTSLIKTDRPCSGGVTPWETVITCEETYALGDANGDGYEDVGWNVQIDPKINRIKAGDGSLEKLWAMGRMNHENLVLASDSLTAYYGEDAGAGNVYKFVANNKMNMSSGTLYVLKLNSGLVANEPTATVGTWVVVPNTTKVQRNTTKSLAASLGATPFSGVEDVEISPLDNKIYFTAKGNNRTYRFKDNGAAGVSNFETFVGGQSYSINYGTGRVLEPWGSGNDNLTFDDKGNLWVLQDGSRNHVWLVRPDHTQADPKVEVFMITPIGSEPTGMTFSPDYKFMFISIQSPSGTQQQMDVAGTSFDWTKSRAVVIARNEFLDGIAGPTSITDVAETNKFMLNTYPNPAKGEFNVSFKLDKTSSVEAHLIDVLGKEVALEKSTLGAGDHVIKMNTERKGSFMLQMIINGEVASKQVVLY